MIYQLLPLIGFFFFAIRRLLTYLHIFQQEEYNPKRFIKWLFSNKAFDKRLTITIIALYLTGFMLKSGLGYALLITGAFIAFAFKEPNPLKEAKKKLVLTDRAKRLGILAFALFDIIAIATAFLAPSILYWIIPVQLIPFCLAAAVVISKPMEDAVNKKFRKEAVEKLEELDPYIVAITGSFGKTSVKHIIGHLMQSHAPTIITPGSVNTEMGITRIIREQLQPHHKFFIVEMGAYGYGSIEKLCRLTPPKLSMLTAVGAAHYERFKTLEDTAKAKLEIAHAARENGGKTIIHSSTFVRKAVQEYMSEYPDHVIRCGAEGKVSVKKVKQTTKGLDVVIGHDGKDYKALVPLYGLHHADNIALSFCVAIELGMKPEDIISSLKTVPQISHRLEVREMDQYTLIDDAYNSNPVGFASALDLLDMLGDEKGGKKVLVTPGMIEMGEQHFDAHRDAGEKAASVCDVAIAVKADRIPSFCDAFMVNMKDENQILFKAESFEQAQAWLQENITKGDVVLLENDLPDLFEKKMTF